MLGRLEAQNSRKLQQRHGKIPSRSNSETNQTFTSKVEQIQQLKSEIQKLKQSKTNNILNKLKTQKQHTSKKNVYTASKSGGQREINVEISKGMTFIKQTMQTLSVYNEKLKICLNTDQTQLKIF